MKITDIRVNQIPISPSMHTVSASMRTAGLFTIQALPLWIRSAVKRTLYQSRAPAMTS